MSEEFKKVSQEETKYTTGAQRDGRAGKGAPQWMPPMALFLVSRIYENGNIMREKLGGGKRNWEKGMPLEDYLGSAIRHVEKHRAGLRDEPHVSMAVWNLLNYLQTAIWIEMGLRPKELNTLPDHITGKELGEIDPLSPMEREWLKVWGVQLPERD